MKTKGREGERKASAFLQDKGYTILERNFRWRGGEIDLIAMEGETIVFCEVKTWDSLNAENLQYAIDVRKKTKLYNTAQVFLRGRQEFLECRMRFDVLFLSDGLKKIRHFPNAFSWSDVV